MTAPLPAAGPAPLPELAASGTHHAPHRNADIEVIRAFAILFVLVEHANFNVFPLCEPLLYRVRPWLQFWSGVDMFFVVSGFVIAGTLLPVLARCGTWREWRRATLAFWVRRAGRLVPTAWLWLGVILVGSAFYNRSNAWYPFRTDVHGVIDSLLDIQNLHIARHFGHSPGASFPFWSLSLEEQFYAVLPVLAWLLGRRLAPFLVVLAAAQFLAVRTNSLSETAMLLNQFRTDGFALGILILLWSRHASWRHAAPLFLLSLGRARILATLAMVASVAFWSGRGGALVPNQLGFVALASGLLVFVASFDRDLLWPAGASRRVLLWLGSRSYGIYVVHIPCFDIVRESWFRATHGARLVDAGGGHLTLAVALALVAAVAELNHRLVERPCRAIGRRIADRIARGGTHPAQAATPEHRSTP